MVLSDRLGSLISLMGDMQIHCVMTLDGRIDEVRLARAVRLLMDTEPVLGCRQVVASGNPVWERREDLDRVSLCSLVATDRPLEECVAFMTQPLDAARDPLVHLRIYRGDHDTLVLKLNHLALDGGGSKACAYLLAALYRALTQDPDHRPTPNVTGRRSFRQVYERLSSRDRLGALRQGLRDIRRQTWPRVWWAFPCREGVQGQTAPGRTYVFQRLEGRQFRAIQAFGREHGATINDVVVAAYYQALIELIRPAENVPLRLRTTADLRRYLPSGRAEALCNLSGFSHPNLGPGLPRSFAELTGRVRDEMNRHKSGWIGLGDIAVLGPLVTLLPFSWVHGAAARDLHRSTPAEMRNPSLTNIGRIDPLQLDFGAPGVRDAFCTASVIYPPAFAMAVTGFGESLTFSAGFCDSAVDRSTVEQLFARMAAILEAFG